MRFSKSFTTVSVREKLEFEVFKVILQWVLEQILNWRFLKSFTTVGNRRNLKFEVFHVIYYSTHWDFLPKFLSLYYYTTLEGVLGVQRSGKAQGTIIRV